MPYLLGFGASSKPREHRYSLLEQADLVEALWGREGIESTVVVAHDYSVSVAQELLARRAAGTLAVDLRAPFLAARSHTTVQTCASASRISVSVIRSLKKVRSPPKDFSGRFDLTRRWSIPRARL